ncbi:MAG: ABC transporter substrate-binding protein [Ardenticatenaceae bacterium]|nr:ABC transporter substrate-binding protein [Ardenticatenaceae bacterium]
MYELELGYAPGPPLSTPWAVAVEKGFDKAEGLKLIGKSFPSGAAMVEALAAGTLKIGNAGDTPAISLISGGAPVKIIAQLADSGRTYALYARKELNIQSPKDLEGRTIALTFGSTSSTLFQKMVEAYGLDKSKINVVDMQPPEIIVAYTRGEIDGFIVWQPFGHKGSQARPTVKLHDAYESYFPAAPGLKKIFGGRTVIIANDTLIQEHPDVVKAYLRVVDRVYKWLADPANRKEAVAILAEESKADEAVIDVTMDQIAYQLTVDDAFLRDVYTAAEVLYDAGKLKSAPAPNLEGWTNFNLLRDVFPQYVTIGGAAQVPSGGPLTKLRISDTTAPSQHTIPEIIKSEGLDKAEGFELEINTVATSAVIGEGLASGDINFASLSHTTAASLLAQGVPIKILAQVVDATRQIPLVARQDLNIQSPKDLEGKTIGLPFGSGATNFLVAFLEKHDINASKVKQIDLRPNDIAPAYARGDIQAFVVWPPALFKAMDQVPSVVLHNGYESFFPSQQGTDRIVTSRLVLVARDDFLAKAENREAVKAYMRAAERAQQILDDPAGRARALDAVSQAIKLDKNDLDQTWKEMLVFQQVVDDDLVQATRDTGDSLYKAGKTTAPPPENLEGWLDLSLLREVKPGLVTAQLSP